MMIGCFGNCHTCPYNRLRKKTAAATPVQTERQTESEGIELFGISEQPEIETAENSDKLELVPVVTDLIVPEYRVKRTITGKLKGVLQRSK